MTTRVMIAIAMAAMFAGAYFEHDLAASYITLIGGFIAYMLHAIEVKLNALLDHHNIIVSQEEIAKR